MQDLRLIARIKKMKALVYTKYGNPTEIFQLKAIQKPVPGDNEILVKVYAATVNRTDESIVTARYFVSRFFSGLFKPTKPTPGTDFAGQIEAIGSMVTAFENGDKIFGFNDEVLSSHAEYLVVPQHQAVVKIPENIDYSEAAASCEGAHYAYNFINKVSLTKGQKVLVNGATGAIGSAAVQLLKYYGVEVVATAATKDIDIVKSLGADRVIDYTQEDFTKGVEDYDFVFDAVGKSSFTKCKPLLKPKGVYISSELGRWGSNIFWALITPILKGKKVIFPLPVNIKKSLLFIKELIEKGKFVAVIDRTYSFEDIIEAYQYVATGQKTGNVVINFRDSDES